jgi:hypothetical protein
LFAIGTVGCAALSVVLISTAPLSFDRATEQVEGMIHRGWAFARVEDAIDAARLSQLHKAALWLLAWSLRDPEVQRRDARLMARAFAVDADADTGLRLCPDLNTPART